MRMFILYTVVIFQLIHLPCRAKEPAPEVQTTIRISDDLPQARLNPEGAIEVDFLDGRVAVLSKSKFIAHEKTIGADIVSNSCIKNFVPINCSYKTYFVIEQIELAWLRHPDPTKIGKMVKMHYGDDDDDGVIDLLNVLTWGEPYTLAVGITEGITPVSIEYTKMTPSPLLSCPSMDWAKQTFKTDSGLISIEEWTSEANAENIETGINENLMAAGYMDVEGVLSEDSISFNKVGFSPRRDGNAEVAFSLGDVIGWSVRREDRSFCEVSLKMDRGSLFAEIISHIFTEKTFEPIKGLSSLTDALFFLEGYNYNVENFQKVTPFLTEDENKKLEQYWVLSWWSLVRMSKDQRFYGKSEEYPGGRRKIVIEVENRGEGTIL